MDLVKFLCISNNYCPATRIENDSRQIVDQLTYKQINKYSLLTYDKIFMQK